MAVQKGKPKSTGTVQAIEDDQGTHFEAVKQIEEDTLKTIKATKTFAMVAIGLIAYAAFMILPSMQTQNERIQKDLTSVLLQSERYQRSARVFSADNVCAQCHLDPDYMLYGLMAKYKDIVELKEYMQGEHQNFFTLTSPLDDGELMEIYRILK